MENASAAPKREALCVLKQRARDGSLASAAAVRRDKAGASIAPPNQRSTERMSIRGESAGTSPAGEAAPQIETVLVSSVTAASRARALPLSAALVVNVIEVAARMLPRNVLPVPSDAELPTRQNTFGAHVAPPVLIRFTDEPLAVVMVLPILNRKNALGSPCKSSVSVPASREKKSNKCRVSVRTVTRSCRSDRRQAIFCETWPSEIGCELGRHASPDAGHRNDDAGRESGDRSTWRDTDVAGDHARSGIRYRCVAQDRKRICRTQGHLGERRRRAEECNG